MSDSVERVAGLRDRLRTRAKNRPIDPRVAAAVAKRGGRPMLFQFEPAWALEPWTSGGYPVGFLERAYVTLGVTDPARVLHMCSGGVGVGITVDIRPEVKPTIVADARHIPLPDESIDWIMADPPYAETYAEMLYGTGSVYPRPTHLLKEAARLLKPGGRVGLLHYIVPLPDRNRIPRLDLERVYGVWCGMATAIRAWSVWQKQQDGHGL